MRRMRAGDAAWSGGTALGVGLALVAIACAYRLLAYRVAMFDGDEYAFALVARDVVHGRLPDVGVFDNKPVGLTYLFALAEALGGETVAALRTLGLIAASACGALLYASSRRLGLSRALALQAGALFLLGTLCLGAFGAMSELLAAPLLAAANLLLIPDRPADRAGDRRWPAARVGAGIALGLACQVTYLAAPAAALTLAGVVLAGPRRAFASRWRDGVLTGAACGAAAAAVWLPQLLGGDLARYLAEQIRYHQGYRAAAIDWDYWRLGFALPLAGLSLPILAAGLLRAGGEGGAKPVPPLERVPAKWLPVHRQGRAPANESGAIPGSDEPEIALVWILGLQILGAALAAAASNRFYPHYLILALPAAALLTAALLAGAPGPRQRLGGIVLAAMLALAAVAPAGFLRARLETPSLEVKAAAAVDRLTAPGQSLFVFDESHAIYFLARRPAASRYVFPTHYLSGCEHAPTIAAPAAVLAQALARRPALVLVGRRCPPEIDAEAQVRSAGYRKVEEIRDGDRRIAVYAPANNPSPLRGRAIAFAVVIPAGGLRSRPPGSGRRPARGQAPSLDRPGEAASS